MTWVDLYAQDAALEAELIYEAYIGALAEAATSRQFLSVALERIAELDLELQAARRSQRSSVEQIRQLMGVEPERVEDLDMPCP